jgi:trans-2,3-dihydro-3-hydroxyanthranilate isomerase
MAYYEHVDVFSSIPMQGNGLAVIFPESEYAPERFLTVAREFRQFESTFVGENTDGVFPVRIFTVDEELPFAGHPLLGTAAVIHRRFFPETEEKEIKLSVFGRIVRLVSRYFRDGNYCSVTMNQGVPNFIGVAPNERIAEIAAYFSLSPSDVDRRFPLDVVSTGLPYLLVPLLSGLEKARIARDGFEEFLSIFGAKFAYLYDTERLECRTWDNHGLVEDVATGSAVGPLCASLVKKGVFREGDRVIISQGRFVGRPSLLECRMVGGEVFVSGDVSFFAKGVIDE